MWHVEPLIQTTHLLILLLLSSLGFDKFSAWQQAALQEKREPATDPDSSVSWPQVVKGELQPGSDGSGWLFLTICQKNWRSDAFRAERDYPQRSAGGVRFRAAPVLPG